ncbi:MAG: restriction endonuclease [Myxococcales bacterium]|nr:restriction endonuclease [Myxococcales bacterium]
MPIPDFQSAMLPILRLSQDGKDHTLGEAIEVIAEEFKATEQERNEVLPSGRQRRIHNRVGWAKTYLQKAGLVEPNGRGRFRITTRGREVLKGKPNRIDMEFLKQFPEYNAFAALRHEEDKEPEPQTSDVKLPDSTETPEEILEDSYQELRRRLADELLERIKGCTPRFFEKLVVDLLVAMGYGGSRKDAGQAVGQSGDEGIDGIIKEDRLGLDVVYIQAKRWTNTVGRPVVQAFAGSLEGQRARKGVLISTSDFSREARDYVRQNEKKIVLIDGAELARLMIDHGIGVTEIATYTVKKLDLDYFGDEE